MKLTTKVLAGTAALVLGAACGSSGTSTASKATSASSGPKGPAITIGTLCSCSGAQASSFALAGMSASAWAKWTNANGGLNGHPVNLIVDDDGGDPATALADVKTLVQQDHVMAIVGETSLEDSVWASYAEQQGVPVVGGHSYEPVFLSNPDFFASGAPVPSISIGIDQEMLKLGLKHLGLVYCAEAPVCAQLTGLSELGGALTGGTITLKAGPASSTAASYDSNCLALKDAGVDGLTVELNATAQQRFSDQCSQLGYTPQFLGSMPTFSRSYLSDKAFQGAIYVSTNANYTDTSIPGARDFLDALHTYAPSVPSSPQFTYITLYPFLGGQLFAAAAKAADLGPSSTPADVKKGLYALQGETLGGLSSPLHYTAGQPFLGGCVFAMSVKSGALVSDNGGAPACLASAQLTGMEQALAKLAG